MEILRSTLKRLASSSLFFILLLGGCASVPTPVERQQTLDSISRDHHLQPQTLQTTLFSLYSLSDTRHCENKEMRVYIEGDGLAWISISRLSDNPTPINPMAAKLMSEDPSSCKVYIARPCQYIHSNECRSEYWDNKRFSPEVIQSYVEALDQLKQVHKIDSFVLIGYSGGGAIAALSAIKCNDVQQLITVAGNIDTDAWVKYHALTPMEGSLNPADKARELSKIPQIHFIGLKDAVIPPEIFESYLKHFSNRENIKSVVCKECTHNSGWSEKLERLLNEETLK